MWPTRQQTPKQLAGAAVNGVAISMLALLPVMEFRHELDLGQGDAVAHVGLAAVLMLAVMTPITILGGRAVFLLREGIRIGRWREEQIEELRRQVERPIWTAAICLAFALGILGLLFTEWHRIFFKVWLFLWMPVTLIFWLRNSLPKPPPSHRIFQ
jgi:hypothetical protein